jgi:hypothetical protein
LSLPGPTELRLLGGVVAGASQQQLARVVALIDGLADRADADRLLERVRPRLRTLGLPRRMGFPRVLFLPLDGLIVVPRNWRPGALDIPRTALATLAGEVHAALGPMAARIDAGCTGRTMEDQATVSALGQELWPAAAGCLPEAAPASWSRAGFADRDYELIRSACLAGWGHAGTTWPARQDRRRNWSGRRCRPPWPRGACRWRWCCAA